MLKKSLPLFLAVAVLMGGAACKAKKTAAELKAEADKVWRTQQHAKAVEYYAEIAEKFPDSEYAAKAKERLNVLGTPPPKAGAKPGAAKPSNATAKH